MDESGRRCEEKRAERRVDPSESDGTVLGAKVVFVRDRGPEIRDKSTKAAFDRDELATLLAALCFWRLHIGRNGLPTESGAGEDFSSYFKYADPLDRKRIERLCERISAAGQHTQCEVDLVSACRCAIDAIRTACATEVAASDSRLIKESLHLLINAVAKSDVPLLC